MSIYAFLLIDKKVSLFFVSTIFFLLMAISYSTSCLQMNYIERFGYHIFAPIYLFGVFIAAKHQNNFIYLSTSPKFKEFIRLSLKSIVNTCMLILLVFFAARTINVGQLVHISNYYPRALDSHAALGKVLSKVRDSLAITSFSFGDAGMTAYQSGLTALDNVGLGSSLVATANIEIALQQYSPDIVVFHSRPDGIKLGDHNQQAIYDWAEAKRMSMVCEIFWKKDYTLRVYGTIPSNDEFYDLCSSSKEKNNVGDKQYFMKNVLLSAPWRFWHE